MGNKDKVFLSLLLLLLLFIAPSYSEPLRGSHETREKNDDATTGNEVRVGVIVDWAAPEGKMIRSSISVAMSDFYSSHSEYRSRVVIHERDSGGEPLQALSAAMDLLQNTQVEVLIVGAESSLEAKFLAELGEKAKIPVILFGELSSSSLHKHRYVVQVTHDEIRESEAILALVNKFCWRSIVLVHEDSEDYSRDRVRYLVDHLRENRVEITSKGMSFEENVITDQLRELKALRRTIFIVHMSRFLLPPFFSCARSLGLMSEGHAWVMTAKSMSGFHYMDQYFIEETMQGVIGIRPYVSGSRELHEFASRWSRSRFSGDQVNMLSITGVWVHDFAWSLAKAAEVVQTNAFRSPADLLTAILESGTESLSDDFQLAGKKLVSNTLEVVNILGHAERRVALWRFSNFSKELQPASKRRHLSSWNKDLETIIWPGGSLLVPQGILLQRRKRELRVLVTSSNRFPQLAEVHTDPKTNITTATGFCVEVFKTALRRLDDEFDVVYSPWPNGSYNNLVYEVFLEKYDAAIGDITITANRSQYVDFTIPFTEAGLGVVVREDKSMWIFLRPLTGGLWLMSGAFFLLTGFVVWLMERSSNPRFKGSISDQIGMMIWFGFSTLVFAQREKLYSNLSRFLVLVWIFVVLILVSSYTAMLTSMMTVQQARFKLSPQQFVGHLSGSYMSRLLNSTAFKAQNLKPLRTPEAYADALSKGSMNGGVSAIVDELPYLRVFLGIYSTGYTMVRTNTTTNGFAFVFQKGSPLVHNMSLQIAKLREEGELQNIETEWVFSPLGNASEDTLEPLTLYEFRGLFIVTGAAFALVLTLFWIRMVRENWRKFGNGTTIVPFESGQVSFASETNRVIQMSIKN